MRVEHDLLGEMNIDKDSYYGIHTKRAMENFKLSESPLHSELVKGLVLVKKAAAITNMQTGQLEGKIADAIVMACDEILSGSLLEYFVVDSLAGGAGTSANMNANEVIANRAIELLGSEKGNYEIVHPLNHVNMSQSTNDVFPTAVRIASIRMLKPISQLLSELQTALQEKEEEFSDVLKVGRTQLQDAVPIMLGQEFGAWAQAISRDRWRIYKSEERLRQVNIGGTAVGTGLNASKKYIFMITEKLRELSGIGLARAEYMMDPTQNTDVFVEVAGLLKTCCVNLSKISSDLRLLSSGPRSGFGELVLPAMQAGSSIMPGKVNPVIPEAINGIAFKVMGLEQTITIAAQSGQLELNAFLPVIAQSLFEIMDLMRNGIQIFTNKCIKGIEANVQRCQELVSESFVLVTALVGHIGYDKATYVAKRCMETRKTVEEILIEESILDEDKIKELLNPVQMTRPGIPGK